MSQPSIESRILADRFEVIRKIGGGGMGVVYEAHDRQLDQRVALKTLKDMSATALYRFKQEFRSLAQIVHTNLVPLYELFSDGGLWFFTMELVAGEELVTFLQRRSASRGEWPTSDVVRPGSDAITTTRSGGAAQAGTGMQDTSALVPAPDTSQTSPVQSPSDSSAPAETTDFTAARMPAAHAETPPAPPRERFPTPIEDFARLRSVFHQLVQGVQALHDEGKLHRDLKPGNVIVRPDGTVVLLDFGLVVELTADVAVESPGPTRPSQGSFHDSDEMLSGTVGYMSPEQAGGGTLTEGSDWYAVGVMLFQALTSELPFSGDVWRVLQAKRTQRAPLASSRCTGIPDDLDQLCGRLLAGEAEARPRGPEILRLLARNGGPSPAEVVPASWGRSLVFIGRDAELALLDRAWEEVVGGRTAVCQISGRSGAGKSALVGHFLSDHLRERSPLVMTGRCYEQESVPYKAIDSLIDALCRHLMRLESDRLESLLPPDVAALARIFPVLHRVTAIARMEEVAGAIPDVQEFRRRAIACLRELLRRLSLDRPIVLSIDDLQWGDVDSARLLSDLLQGENAPRLLLLACSRTEYKETSQCLAVLAELLDQAGDQVARHVIAVEPLRDEETLDLALRLLGQDSPQNRSAAEEIVREARGSPLFVYELVRHVQSGGDLGGPRLELDEVLWRRVSALAEASRLLLEVVAVAGQPVRLRWAAEAAGLPSVAPQVVARLRADHLIRSTGPRLDDDVETFHDRIRESIVTRLPRPVLVGHHGQLAVTLESDPKADPETLAAHFDEAEQRTRAGQYYAVAADQAATALAFDRAAALFRRAIERGASVKGDGPSLRTRLAGALANAGRGPEAAREYLASAQGERGTERLDLERRAAFHHCASGMTQEGLAGLKSVLSQIGMSIPTTPARSVASLLWRRFQLWWRGIEFHERGERTVPPPELERIDVTWSASAGLSMLTMVVAADFQTRNLLMALEAGEPFRIARSLAWEAAHYGNDGLPAWPKTQQLLERAQHLADRVGRPEALGMVLLARGTTHFSCGRFRESREELERAAAVFRQQCTGVAWELGTLATFQTWNLTYLGEWAEMGRRTTELLREAAGRGDLYTATNLATYCEPLRLLAADRPEEAGEVIRRHMQAWEPDRFHLQHTTSLLGQVYVDLYAGRFRQAMEAMRGGWKRMKEAQFHRVQIIRIVAWELIVRTTLACAAQDGPDRALVRDAERWIQRLMREKSPVANALAELHLAGCFRLRGHTDQEIRHLRSAIRGLDSIPMQMLSSAARCRLGGRLGGDEGKALRKAGEEWMLREGVKDTQSVTRMLTPWADGR
jgi:serine/threonine protein kinase/tetratricopeptide (TPR) repeat protein